MDTELLIDLAKPILSAVMSGQWAAGAALALVLIVALARKYGAKRFPFLTTDAGGTALTLVGSFGGALATALLAGTVPSLGLAYAALGIAVAASGGYTMIRRLVAPLLRKLASKLPGPFQSIATFALDLVLGLFEKKNPTPAAEAAGEAAVQANPAPGAEGITGAHREVR